MEKPNRVVMVTVIGILALTNDAHAYLDPGSGSLILQALVAGFLGVVLSLRVYWQKLIAFFSGTSKPTKSSKPTESSKPIESLEPIENLEDEPKE